MITAVNQLPKTGRVAAHWWWLPLATALSLLTLYPSEADFHVSQLFYREGEGFYWRRHWLLEAVLHDGMKWLACAIWLGALLYAWALRKQAQGRVQRLYLVLALSCCALLPVVLKPVSNIHCPWSLESFGGQQHFRELWQPAAAGDKPGRCWPGGHASAGFAILAFFFYWRDERPARAKTALYSALAFGALLSAGRIAQGAHFLSHNLWTLIFDWCVCLALYQLLLASPRKDAAQ